jgi:thiol-disulfide isomerase/thioredoxin
MRIALLLLALATTARAGIIEDVRDALAKNNVGLADSEVRAFKAQHGPTPEFIEALSWIGRGALAAQQLDAAEKYARETQALAAQQLKKRSLDAEPHLPQAVGASFEIQAQVLAARGQRAQAISLLQGAIRTYRTTSIRARLQKNLNLISLVGHPAPELSQDQFLGAKFTPLAQLKGSPVLVFFWAHWCGDCKYESPIITRLRAEYAAKGLTVVAPTMLYGYAGQGEDATPQTELAWIDKVRHQFYSGLLDVPVPISKHNFDTYGASTTPTLVLIDRKGVVDLYHPGLMSYADLRSEVDKVMAR